MNFLEKLLALNDPKNDGNDRNDQQHVYDAAHMESKEAECPSDDQDYR
jgi:hypothetical protein